MRNLIYAVVLILSGCAYSVKTNVLGHLKTITIATFENQTDEFGLEEDLLNYLASRFSAKNLKSVTIDPDCIINGRIVSYEDKIYEYDSNDDVKSYQIKIVFAVEFLDLVKNDELLDENKMSYSELYTIGTDEPAIELKLNSDSDQEKKRVQQEIFKDFFEDIDERSFEVW